MKNIYRARLSNGLKIIHLYTKNDPISACHLLIPRGTLLEPSENAGITMLHWALLLKGTDQKSARQIAEDLDSIGASIGAGATHDYSEVSCHSVSDTFWDAMEILQHTLFNPAFPPSEVEKEKNALIAAIRSKKEHIFTVANETLNGLLFGGHPYGRSATGTEESVRNLNRQKLMSWHEEVLSPNEAVLTIASNVPFKTIYAKINKLFGSTAWKKTAPLKKAGIPGLAAIPSLRQNASAQLSLPFEQAYLLIGYPAPGVGDNNYLPLKILNACLGGGMSARLFQQLREQQGLAYDVGTFYPSKIGGSCFVAYLGLQYSKLEQARIGIEEALELARVQEIPKQELHEIKSYMKGTYILDHQTNSQRAHYLGWWEVQGIGSENDKRYLDRIDKITSKDVLKTAKKVLSSSFAVVEVHPQKNTSIQKIEDNAIIS